MKRVYLLLVFIFFSLLSGQNNVCFDIEENPNPNDAALGLFTKYVNVLDCIHIYAVSSITDEKVLHVAAVAAELIDNNEDGIVDDPIIEFELNNNVTVMPIFHSENSNTIDEFFDHFENCAGAILFRNEIDPSQPGHWGDDATVEEVLHTINACGHVDAYPSLYALEPNSSYLTDAMDVARGGQFISFPGTYPDESWYHYDDWTCDYGCMAMEYLYWCIVTNMGILADNQTCQGIANEWEPCTPELFETTDTLMFNLVTDPENTLPQISPDGNYCPVTTNPEVIGIKTGSSFGECLGYCLSELTITVNQVNYTLYGWDENDPVYIPVAISDTVDFIVWEDLNTQFNFELFMSLDSIIGCPDCSDGGSEWFEITTSDTIKRVTIEYGQSIDGLDGYINSIRTIRQGYEQMQACFYTPNVGPCDAAFLRYYFDQEQQECMTFTWGGCNGLVPFETMEECESSCFYDDEQGSAVTGYLRASELSFCMDNCGLYYVEDENGSFISNVSNLNNYIEQFNYYINRFVEIEGDNIQCSECSAINVSSITISGDCENPVSCLVDPCFISSCGEDPNLNCVSNYCDGCYADYYDNDDLVICNLPTGVLDLTDVDFGDCEMLLGFGWVSNHCQAISGCSFTVDSVNYSGALFSSNDECANAATLEIDQTYPNDFYAHQNYPNPFNPVTSITYQISFDANVNITIYDMSGRLIKTLLDGKQSAGHKSILWNARNNKNEPVSAGIYLYTIKAGNYRKTRKMVLIK